MKRLLAWLLIVCAGAAHAGPFAITGQGTPAAGSVPLTSLATEATNTVVGNATSGTASPTALAVGSCSTAASALIWTTNTGFGCNTSITAANVSIDIYGVRGLQGANNAGTPDTQYDVSANSVLLVDSAGVLASVRRNNTGTVTNNFLTAGSAANGRDQAGAFSANTFVHLYWIWNGTTLATVSSAVAPPTGPTLPATYTHWAYIGAYYFPSSALLKTYTRGTSIYLQDDQQIVSSGTTGSEVSTSLAALVPTNALSYDVNWNAIGSPSSATETGFSIAFKLLTAVTFSTQKQTAAASIAGSNAAGGAQSNIPYVGGTLIFQTTLIGAPTGVTTAINLTAYKVPNGGE